MAGAHITVTIDDTAYQALLARLAAFGGSHLQETFGDLGEALKNSHEDRARRQIDPDGVPWVKLSEDYEQYKKAKRPGRTILKFDLHMLGDMFSYDAGDAALQLGTNAVYGAIQQWGGTSDMAPGPAAIPRRAFIGLSNSDGETILEILGEHLQSITDAR